MHFPVTSGLKKKGGPEAALTPLRGGRELLDRFDADHCGNRRNLKAVPRVAEVLLGGTHIEPPGNLLGCGDGELAAGDLCEAAALKFVLEGFAFRLGTL